METSDPTTAQTEIPDLTSRVLGDYKLLRRLGRGGMADVYLAKQKSLSRQVAFKTLHSNLALDRKYVERFHREAMAAAGLNQANIVQIYEVGEAEGIHFIVQEYIRGQNLKQYMQRHGVLDPVLAVNVIRQVTAALQVAADSGVIHRDIKPENIMLTPSGEVKVTDFGLARVTHENKTELTQVGVTMGTPLYMSPEQVEGNPVDARTDIYSLGITSFQMLVGRPPFEAETPLALAIQHVKKQPPRLTKLRPDLPRELCELVQKMMAKKPIDRFQSPGELLKAVRRIQVEPNSDWATIAETLRLHGDKSSFTHHEQLAETRKLESLILGHIPRWWQSRKLWFTNGILMIAGIGLGLAMAFANPPPPVLPEARLIANSGVPKQETVVDQYRWAYTMVGRGNNGNSDRSSARAELAWKSVKEYFPPYQAQSHAEVVTRNLWIRRAEERLGELYLRNREWEKAHEVYNSLAMVEKSERRFHIVGCAGLAVVFYNKGDHDSARNMLFLIEPDMDLLNDFMKFEIEMILEDYFGD